MSNEWEYKIAEADLGYNIYRKKEYDGLMSLDYLGANMKWIKDKGCAKIFYHRDDAVAGLVLAKVKGRIEETSETQSKSEEISEKKSWSEL